MILDATYESIAATAKACRYHGISDALTRFLYEQASLVPSHQHIVEIGSFVGYSTIFLAGGGKAGFGAGVHCVDPWGLQPSSSYSAGEYADKLHIDDSVLKEFRGNIRRAGLEERVVEHRAYGHEEGLRWTRGPGSIGLLFIDGDHSEWGAFIDFHHWRAWLADNAYVVFHDFGDGQVTLACMRINRRCMRDARLVGSSYGGREALAFRYKAQPVTISESFSEAYLVAVKWLEKSRAGLIVMKVCGLARGVWRRITRHRSSRFPSSFHSE